MAEINLHGRKRACLHLETNEIQNPSKGKTTAAQRVEGFYFSEVSTNFRFRAD